MDDQYHRDRRKWKVVGDKGNDRDSEGAGNQKFVPWISKYDGKWNSSSSSLFKSTFDFEKKSRIPVFSEVQNFKIRSIPQRKFDDIRNATTTTTSSSSSLDDSENTSSSSEESSSSSQYEWREATPVYPMEMISASVGGYLLPGLTRGLITLIPLKSVFVILFPNNAPDDLNDCLEKLWITPLTRNEAKFITRKLAKLADAELRTYTAGGEIYVAQFSPGDRACALTSLQDKYEEILDILFSSNPNVCNTDLNNNKSKCFKSKLKKCNENCAVVVGSRASIRKCKPSSADNGESNIKNDDSAEKVAANDESDCFNASNCASDKTMTDDLSVEPESSYIFPSAQALLSKNDNGGGDCKSDSHGVQAFSKTERKIKNVPVLHHLFPENEVSDVDDNKKEEEEEDLINLPGKIAEITQHGDFQEAEQKLPADTNGTKESSALGDSQSGNKGNVSTKNNNAKALNENSCTKTPPVQSSESKDSWASMLSVELMSSQEKPESQTPQCQTAPTVRFLKTSDLMPCDEQNREAKNTDNDDVPIADKQIETCLQRKKSDKSSSNQKEESDSRMISPVKEESKTQSLSPGNDRKPSPHTITGDTRVVIRKKESLATPKNTIPSSVVKVVLDNNAKSNDIRDEESSDSVLSANNSSSRDGEGFSEKSPNTQKYEKGHMQDVKPRRSTVTKPSIASIQEKNRSKLIQKSQKILQTREKRRNERLQRHYDDRSDCSPDNQSHRRTDRSEDSRGRSSSAHSREGSARTQYSQGRSQSPRSSDDWSSSKRYTREEHEQKFENRTREIHGCLGSSESRPPYKYYGPRDPVKNNRYGKDCGGSLAPRNRCYYRYFPSYPKSEYVYSPGLYSSLSSSDFDFSDDDGFNAAEFPKRKILRTKSAYNSARERSKNGVTKNVVDWESPLAKNGFPYKKCELTAENAQRARLWRFWRARHPTSSLEEFEHRYRKRTENPEGDWSFWPEIPRSRDVTVESIDCVVPSLSCTSISADIDQLVVGIRRNCAQKQKERQRQNTNQNQSNKSKKQSSHSYRPRRRSHSPSCMRTFSPRSTFVPNTLRRRSLSPVYGIYSSISNKLSHAYKRESHREHYDRLEMLGNTTRHNHIRAQQQTMLNEARMSSASQSETRVGFGEFERNAGNRKTGNAHRSLFYAERCEESNDGRKCKDDITHRSMHGATQVYGTNVLYRGYQTQFSPVLPSSAFCRDVELLNNPFVHSPATISQIRDNWAIQTIESEVHKTNNEGGGFDFIGNDTFSRQRTRSCEESQQIIILKDDPNNEGIANDMWPFSTTDNDSSADDNCDTEVESLMFRTLSDIRISVNRKKAKRVELASERKSLDVPVKETNDKISSKQPQSEHNEENNIVSGTMHTVLLEKEVTSTRKRDSPHTDRNVRCVCVEETHVGVGATNNNIHNSHDLEPALQMKSSDTPPKEVVLESQATGQKFSASDGRSWKKVLLRKAQNSYDQGLSKQTHSPTPLRDSTNVATIQQQKHSGSFSVTNEINDTVDSESNMERGESSPPVQPQLNEERIGRNSKNAIPDIDVNVSTLKALIPEVTCGLTKGHSEVDFSNIAATAITSATTFVHTATKHQKQSVTKSTDTNVTPVVTSQVAVTSPKVKELSEVRISTAKTTQSAHEATDGITGQGVGSFTGVPHTSAFTQITHTVTPLSKRMKLVNSLPKSIGNLNSKDAVPSTSVIEKASLSRHKVPTIRLGRPRSTGIVVPSTLNQQPQQSSAYQASRPSLPQVHTSFDARSRHFLPRRVPPVIQNSPEAISTTDAAYTYQVTPSHAFSTRRNMETHSTSPHYYVSHAPPVSTVPKPRKSILRVTETLVTTVTNVQTEDVTTFINNLDSQNQPRQRRRSSQKGGTKSSLKKKKVTKRRLPKSSAKGRGKRRKRLPSISSDEDIIEELNSTVMADSKERISHMVQKETVTTSEEDDSDECLISFMQIPVNKKEASLEPEINKQEDENVSMLEQSVEGPHNAAVSSENNFDCDGSSAVIENAAQNDEEDEELVEACSKAEQTTLAPSAPKDGDSTIDDDNIFSKMSKVMTEDHGGINEETRLHDCSIANDSSTPEAEQDLLSQIVKSSILNTSVSSTDTGALQFDSHNEVPQMNLHEPKASAETTRKELATSVTKLPHRASSNTSCVGVDTVPILPTPPTSPKSSESTSNNPTFVASSTTSLATTSKFQMETTPASGNIASTAKPLGVSQLPWVNLESTILAMPEGENCHGFLEVCMSAEGMNLFSLRRIPYVKIMFGNAGPDNQYRSNSCATYLRLRDIISLLKLKPKELSFLITLCELKLFRANIFTCKLFETVYDPVCTKDPTMAKLTMRKCHSKMVQMFLDRMITLDEFLHTLLPRFYFERLGIQVSDVPKYVNVKIFKPIFRIDDEVIKIFRKPYEYNAVLLTKDDQVKCKPLKAMKVPVSKTPKSQKTSSTPNKSSVVQSSPNVPAGSASLNMENDCSVTQLQQALRYACGATSNRFFDATPMKLHGLNSAYMKANRFTVDNGHMYNASNQQVPFYMKSFPNRSEAQIVSQNRMGIQMNPNLAQSMAMSNRGRFELRMPPPSYMSSVLTRPSVIRSSIRTSMEEHRPLSTGMPFQMVQSVASYPNLNPCVRIGPLMTVNLSKGSIANSSIAQTNRLETGNNRSREESGTSDADLAITSVFSLKANASNQPTIQQEKRNQRDDFSDITENSSDEDNVVADNTSSSLLTTKEYLSNASKVLSNQNRDATQGESGLVLKLRSRNNLLKSGLNVANDAAEQQASANEMNEMSFDSSPTQNVRLKGVTLDIHQTAKLLQQLSSDNDDQHLSGVVSKLKSRIQTSDVDPTKAKRRKKNSSEGGKRLRGQPKTSAVQKS